MKKTAAFLCALLIANQALCKDSSIDKEIQKISVRLELNKLFASDQGLRHEIERLEQSGYPMKQLAAPPFLTYWTNVDKENCAHLKEIIKKWGWPTLSAFGDVADNQAWIIVQHATFDPAFQKRILTLLQEKIKTHDTNPRNYAYLFDRINTTQGKEQLYGTQGHCLKKSLWVPEKITDPQHLDERRKAFGIEESMASYKKQMNGYCY